MTLRAPTTYCEGMSAFVRTLVVTIVALWLPLCCCQVMAISSNGGCCASASAADATDRDAGNACCCDHDESEDERSPAEPTDTCRHCVDKGMPPAPIALDAFFIATQLPIDLALPPSAIDAALAHATQLTGSWNHAPSGEPPAPPVPASTRCSRLSIWLI